VETAAATVQASAGPAAASTADASRATETGDRTARGGGEAAARAGGRFELDGAASRPETTIDRSAYRSAMADRAAGRDLAPAERQARAIDERIALARTEAAARASGTSSGTMVARGQGLAAAATAGPALPPSGRGMSAVGGATREAAPLTASSGGTTSPPPTGAAATNPGVVDGGVPARPGPMAPAGVPADAAGSATGRPTADEAVAHALRGVRMLTGRGGGTMTLRLQPGDLGDLRVRVDIRGGRVTAEFKTTTEAARSQIERGLETLRRGLEERGLQVERLTVRGGESEGARPNADGSRAGRDDSADGRDRGGGGSGDGGRDDAAGRQSDGRRDESQGRRPLGERASSPDALRAFASIFGERLQ